MSINNDKQSITELYNNKKYDEVISTALRLFADEEAPLEIKQKVALSHFYKNDYENSLTIFEDIASRKNDVESWFNVLTSLMASGKMKEAKETFYKILKMHKGLKSQQPRELAVPFIRYYFACGLCDAGCYDDALEQIEELREIYMELKITDDTFLYIRGVPFLSQTLELAKKVFDGQNRDFSNSVFLEGLRNKVDDDGKKLIRTYSGGINNNEEGILRDVNITSHKHLANHSILTCLMLGALAIGMIAIIIILVVVNSADKPMHDLVSAIIMCSVVILICIGIIIYFFVLSMAKPIKNKPEEYYAMKRTKRGVVKFIYNGSKDDFIEKVQSQICLFNTDYKTDYITEIKDGNLSIGIGRTGHGSGLWYEPAIIENENSIIIDGAINDVSWHADDAKWWQSLIIWIFVVLPLYAILSPLLLFRLIFSPLVNTPKKQLIEFMVKYVDCTEMRSNKS